MAELKQLNPSKNPKSHKFGKICTFNQRQPLVQITHYPKSLLIDDFYLDNVKHGDKIHSLGKQKIIKFVGNYQQNVNQIIESLDSLRVMQNKLLSQNNSKIIKDQIAEILNIFYAKIQKMRKQRDFYKLSYQSQKNQSQQKHTQLNTQLLKLKQQNYCLQKQKQTWMVKYQEEQKKKRYFQRQCDMLNQKVKYSHITDPRQQYETEQRLDLNVFSSSQVKDQDKSQVSELNESTRQYCKQIKKNLFYVNMLNKKVLMIEQSSQHQQQQQQYYEPSDHSKRSLLNEQRQQIQLLMRRHNLQPFQLRQIIEEYLKQLKQQNIQFQTQQQKRFYFMAKKMQSRIWNKKVKRDIQKLMMAKENQHKTEKSFKRK